MTEEAMRGDSGAIPEQSVLALALDGSGGAVPLPAGSGLPEQSAWIHLDYS